MILIHICGVSDCQKADKRFKYSGNREMTIYMWFVTYIIHMAHASIKWSHFLKVLNIKEFMYTMSKEKNNSRGR